MFDRIIVPLDGSLLSDQIVGYAGALALGMHAPVQLLHVVDPDIPVPEQPAPGAHPIFYDQLLQQREAWARVYLQEAATRLRAAGVEAEVQVAVGSPPEVIAAAGDAGAQTLIAMANHGRAGIGRMFMGSVTEGVLRLGHAPLLVVHPRDQRVTLNRPPATVIVALEGSTLAERSLSVGHYLARAFGASLLLTRAVTNAEALVAPDALSYWDYNPLYLAIAEARKYLEERERDARTMGLDAQSLVLEGDPGRELARLAADTPHCLIIMTTHGRTGLRRAVLGSVADEVVRRAGTPVLLLRAAD